MKLLILASLTGTSLLAPVHALAVLRSGDILSARLVSHRVERGSPEICALPLHFPGALYDRRDAEEESSLCFHSVGHDVAGCPKTYSTNPGVDFHVPPDGMSIDELTKKECEVKGSKKSAKYKLSISCSYSPSLLAYYHVSRVLGNIVNVPPAVLRTMDLERHRDQATRAVRLLRKKKMTGEAIYKWWTRLREDLASPGKSSRADLLFVEGFEQSYGALQRNPLGEERYDEFNNKTSDRENEFKAKNPIYAALTRLDTKVPRDFNVANVQAMRQLKDAADFILLDTILGQQDRFGNIHYKEVFYYVANTGGKISLEKSEWITQIPKEHQKQAFKVKEMMLKDNDCGVAKEHRIKKAKLLDPVAHMDPQTYAQLMAFDRIVDSREVKELFVRGLQFTERDHRVLARNVHEAARLLQENCRSGRLALDLDLAAHFTGAPLPPSYRCE
jgi:hypothetical protein